MWGREHKATLKKRDGETVHSKHTHSVSSTGQLHIWETEEKIEKSVFEYIDNWFNWYDWCMWWMARGEEKRECMNMRVSVSAVAPLLPARPSGTSDGGKPTQQSGPGGAACWVFPPPTLLARVNMIGQDWTTFWRRSTFANSGWGQATPPAPQRHQLLWISQERGCRTNKTAEEEQEKNLKSERPSSRQIVWVCPEKQSRWIWQKESWLDNSEMRWVWLLRTDQMRGEWGERWQKVRFSGD